MSRSRNYCITLNNPDPTTKETLLTENTLRGVVFAIVGAEVGEGGTPHLQGYVAFKNPKTLAAAKRAINLRAHLTKANGSAEQNVTYCSKEDGDPWTFGEVPAGQGRRNDLTVIDVDAIKAGTKVREFLHQNPKSQAFAMHMVRQKYFEKVRDFKGLVVWIFGAAGIGKTRRAHEHWGAMRGLGDPDDNTYVKNDTKWWDGYDRHEVVLIDDFRPSWWKMTYMLRAIDRYAMQVEVKNGARQLVPKLIVITSIRHPNTMYQMPDENGVREPNDQLIRRIDIIEELTTTPMGAMVTTHRNVARRVENYDSANHTWFDIEVLGDSDTESEEED